MTDPFVIIGTTLEKAEDGDGVRRVRGLASTASIDREGEVLLQEGMDVDPLLRSGHINWNHYADPRYIIGEPTRAEFRETPRGRGLWIEGILYKGVRVADEVWELLCAIERAREQGLSHRRLGWSVQGAVLERDPQNPAIVRKSVIRHMALTAQPVNPDTFAELAKALGPERCSIYPSLGDFAKAMGMSAAAAGDAQSLVGRPRARAAITRVPQLAVDLLDELGERCRSCRGRPRRHLVRCSGLSPEDAELVLAALRRTVARDE